MIFWNGLTNLKNMKRKINYYAYSLAIAAMSMFLIAGCSDDETIPDSDTGSEALFNLTLEVNPVQAGDVTGAGEYQEGELVSVTATSNEGWEFVSWSGDIDHIDDAESPEVQVTIPAEDISLTANFLEIIDPEPFTVIDVDGNVYPTVIIGDQEWMAENLRVSRYNNLEPILTDLDNTEWEETMQGAYSVYSNFEEEVETYGKLYNWYAVDDERGLCPAGWRVASNEDWTELVDYVVEQGFVHHAHQANSVANALKSCRQVDSPFGDDCDTSEHPRWASDEVHNGFDEFGFSALPGGTRLRTGTYRNVGGIGFWWTSSELSETRAIQRNIAYTMGHVVLFNDMKTAGFSVRCVRDAEN